MTEKKVYLLIGAAILLLALSVVIPLVITFSPLPVPTDASVSSVTQRALEPSPSPLPSGTLEMRGLWIATHSNINFPSKQGLSKETLAEELDSIVAFAKQNGFNTILFQVRPAADSLYKSEIFPASKVVSGEYGKSPDGDFDCLGYLLETAHTENIEVHAWVNPLRAALTSVTALPSDSPVRKYPELVVEYADGKSYFDAGQPRVRELVASGVKEICENYDVDGIIFDDYFYPYPKDGAEFDDAATYVEYGGGMTLGDFRRDSVNKLVELCYNTVKEVDSEIEFGISPFGIWQNGGKGSATRGFEAYESIYCDALAWAKGGYVDYIAPQIYWSFDTAVAPFATLAEWWDNALMGTGVTLYINHGVYKYDEGGMQNGEITKQVELSRTLDAYRGSMFYGYAALKNNTDGVLDETNAQFENIIIYFSSND
ncbi:MAG: family 10 glycosylhydrolase [Clostridia bacterium]|nr:family 10 glycosylhydrolase [Clostridia bacterium]